MTDLHGTADIVAHNNELAEALTRAGIGDVDDSTLTRIMYATDASLYRIVPQVVVSPRDIDEVIALCDVARQFDVPIVARGAGTSCAGNAIGAGIVVDFRRHMNRVIEVDGESHSAVVQPGVVLADLQRHAGRVGLRFGPDPSTHDRCTLGGMIGNNACGSRALQYGRTADNVERLDVVLATGEALRLGRGERAIQPLLSGAASTSLSIYTAISAITEHHANTLNGEFGQFIRQVSGYSLEHLVAQAPLPQPGFDVAKMFVGTEGTLGLVVGAELAMTRTPKFTSLTVAGYPDVATAGDAVPAILQHHPTAVEGLDVRLTDAYTLRTGRDGRAGLPQGRGWLLIELADDDDSSLRSRVRQLRADLDALEVVTLDDPRAIANVWRIRLDGAGLASTAPSGEPAHVGWEDAAVRPDQLGQYLRAFDELLVEHRLSGMPYGHFGDGCIHARIDFPLDEPDGAKRYREFVFQAAQLVARYDGSMSGEHGDGRARSELLPLMYSPQALQAMSEIKAVFDPNNLMNPGIIVDPVPLDEQIRPLAPRRSRVAPLTVVAELAQDADRCIGVGKCVTGSGAHQVMCPSYQATGEEKDSTRGRARVLQAALSGDLLPNGLDAPEVHEALDLCLSCRACRTECPAGVDMAEYKSKVLYEQYDGKRRPRSHYSLGRLPTWARLASISPRVANGLMGTPGLARIVKTVAGIDARRTLPAFAKRSAKKLMDQHRAVGEWSAPISAAPLIQDRRDAILWIDTFTNRFNPGLAVTALQVLTDAGYNITPVAENECCGLTLISTGQLDHARKRLERTVSLLAPLGTETTPIIGLEPSCLAVLRVDGPELLPTSAAAQSVAHRVVTFAEALQARGDNWLPPDLSGVSIVMQPHCHQRAVLGTDADIEILTRAGAVPTVLGGCCGLAGNFGMEHGHYDVSVAVAETQLLPALQEKETAFVLADGFSCRTQINDLVGRQSFHLAELIDRAGQLRPPADYPNNHQYLFHE